MNIEIWSIGKANEKHIDEGIEIYFKKIKNYCPIKLEIIQPKKTFNDIQVQKEYEEELILKKLQPDHKLVLLDERGKMMNSPQIAQLLQQKMNMSTKTLIFLIGGAYGVTPGIMNKAENTWSLSSLVFPHQLVRLILAEQIYRGFSIINNLPYHHS